MLPAAFRASQGFRPQFSHPDQPRLSNIQVWRRQLGHQRKWIRSNPVDFDISARLRWRSDKRSCRGEGDLQDPVP